MGKKLYVGNLSYSVTSESLGDLFAEKGDVESSRVVTDRETGRSKGFAFVEFANDSQAMAALQHFHGMDFEGRQLNVSEARPQAPREGGGGGGGGGRGFGGGGGGGRY